MTFPDPRNPDDLDPDDLAALGRLTEADLAELRALSDDDARALRVLTGQVDPVVCDECGKEIAAGADVAFRLADDGRVTALVHLWHGP